MKVLVTGGAGFIGSHLSRVLIKEGHDVTVLDNLETSIGTTTDVTFVSGSILDENLVRKLIKNADYVVHLAATVGVARIMNSPLWGLRTNVIGSEIVIRNCALESRPILLTSSSEIYGKNTSHLLNETSDRIIGVPQISRWSYSDSKALEEAFALAYFKEEHLPVKIVRLFNTVGPGQLGNYGMVLPRFMRSAIDNESINIYGDGNQTRCFMHVSDAVNGIINFINNESHFGEVINLGNPHEISIHELAIKVKSYSNSDSVLRFIPHQEIFGQSFEDMERRVPDISKAQSLLGWSPIKSIDDIIQETYNFEIAKSL